MKILILIIFFFPIIVFCQDTCTGTPTVVYGGMTYNTVQIGTQCWLRENLNIGTQIDGSTSQTNNSVLEKYCYNNDTNNCNIYGGLYQWAEMVQYLNGATNTVIWNPVPTGNVQGICPTGWHIPTNTEVATFVTYLGGSIVAGGKMKEVGLIHWGIAHCNTLKTGAYNIGATNESGFTVLPSGRGMYDNVSKGLHECGTFWTITPGTLARASYFYGVMFALPNTSAGENNKASGIAVRCLKD